MIGKDPLKFYVVDAFTSKAFEGGPAGVVFLKEFLPDDVLQRITAEINHANTAFLVPLEDSADPLVKTKRFAVRWFARHNEVFLCGHATLAAGHVLFYQLGNLSQELIFEPTRVAPLRIRRGTDKRIVLTFPLNMPSPLTPKQEVGFEPLIRELRGKFKILEVLLFGNPVKKLLVRLDDNVTRRDLETAEIDPDRLMELHPKTEDFAGVILTLKGELHCATPDTVSRGIKEYHFISRYFAPWNGIPEDPACGSAHTLLAPYWSSKLGKKHLVCRQCSPRGAELLLDIREDGLLDISGESVTILCGELHL